MYFPKGPSLPGVITANSNCPIILHCNGIYTKTIPCTGDLPDYADTSTIYPCPLTLHCSSALFYCYYIIVKFLLYQNSMYSNLGIKGVVYISKLKYLFKFSKHRPSGPMLSISRNVRPSVCVSVCPCVHF